MTQGLYSGVYFHHFAENRTINSRDIKKGCNPISFHLKRPCCDPRDPAVILAIMPRSCRVPAAIIVIHAALRSIAIVL